MHLGPGYRGRLGRKTVVVLDDCTTHGMSLEGTAPPPLSVSVK